MSHTRRLIFNNTAQQTSSYTSFFYFLYLTVDDVTCLSLSSSSSFWCRVIAPNRYDLHQFQWWQHRRDLLARRQAVASWYYHVTQQKCLQSRQSLWFPRRRPRLHAVIVPITYWRWYWSLPQGGVIGAGLVSDEEKVFCSSARRNSLMLQCLFTVPRSHPEIQYGWFWAELL